MISIIEQVPKPSDAVLAMVNGIKNQLKRDDFQVNMDSFGGISLVQKYCYGCAATSAIQEIAHKNFDLSSWLTIGSTTGRAKYLEFYEDELDSFETSINSLRLVGFRRTLLDNKCALRSFFSFYTDEDVPLGNCVDLEDIIEKILSLKLEGMIGIINDEKVLEQYYPLIELLKQNNL